jgi:uncharacterized protein YndB with AHSA1/START domain
MQSSRWSAAAALLLLFAPPSRAEVVETTANSMKVREVLQVNAPPEKVWQAFMQVSKWWSSDHTWSGSAANLRLDGRAGGCFCETLPNDGSVQHMVVIFVAPNQRMTMTGGLGPLQTAGVAGALTFQITPKATASEMAILYNVGGYYPGGLTSIAPGVDGVLTLQFDRLKRLIETGNAEEKKPVP